VGSNPTPSAKRTITIRKFPIVLTRRIKFGIAFVYLAGLGWLAEIFIPFSGLTHKLSFFTVDLVASEVLFVIGVALMGKPLYLKLKTYLIEFIKQR
jgi:hypothetical protein